MKTIIYRDVFKGAIWTAGSYGLGQLTRLVTNVFLTRLLAPELFGIMALINTIRLAFELFSDIGIAQNIVFSKNAEQPDFYNTAWTLRAIRGFVLSALCSIAAFPLARFYNSPILAFALPVFSLFLVISGLNSMSRILLNKRLQYFKVNAYDTSLDILSSVINVTFVFFDPTIWGLIFGILAGAVVRLAASYLILGGRHRFYISRKYLSEIFNFGRWIFISSIVFFLSMNFDRLYLAKAVPLALFGVYAIARSLSDLFGPLVGRLGGIIIFPLISASADKPRAVLRAELARMRFGFVLLVAVGISIAVSVADLAVHLLYDQRYQAAGWMLSILLVGAWFTILCNLNESMLLGIGAPQYNAVANSLKFGWLLIGLPLGFMYYGLFGLIAALAAADICRYVPVSIGQIRKRFSFAGQDLVATLVMFGCLTIWEWLRWHFGYGLSFREAPIF